MSNLAVGRLWAGAIALIASAALSNGCVTKAIRFYEPRPVDQYPYRAEQAKLAIAIHPFSDTHEVETYFGTDLLSAGVMPILVVAENHSTSSSFVLSRDRISLATAITPKGRGTTSEDLDFEPSVNAWAGWTTSLPLALIAAKLNSDASAIEHSLVVRELRTTTLSPGEMAHGFAYFQFPESADLQQWVVHLDVSILQSTETLSFHIALDPEEE